MLSLLWGLLFQPRVTIESILKTPNLRQASQLNFLILLLLMVNVVFLFATDPTVGTLGNVKWVLAFFIPPLQYWIQRLVYSVSVRLGLLMFSSNRLPHDPMEKRHKLALVHYAFPFVIYPVMICFMFSTIFDSPVFAVVLQLIGVISMFVLITQTLKQLYDLKTAQAFWGPFLVQLVIGVILMLIIGLSLLLYVYTHGGTAP